MLERIIERALVARVQILGGLCEKFTSPGRRSVPDRIVSLPGGRLIFVECKASGKQPAPLQARDHASRRALGFEVRVISTLQAAKGFPDAE